MIAYFDCFSGISGDMTLGALVDAGVSIDILRLELSKLGLDGYGLKAESIVSKGLQGTLFTVQLDHTHNHEHRHLSHILDIIDRSALDEGVKATSASVFRRLASAEARVHGVDVEHVHFHEVGAVDAIVDVVGAVIGLKALGVKDIYASPLPTGSGMISAAHGTIPVPAPATLELLRQVGAPLRPSAAETELVTPTGAAILATLATFKQPEMRIQAVGHGFGRKSLPWPNCLRLWLGRLPAEEPERDTVSVLETNLDDMTPELLGATMDRLLAAGALDVHFTPTQMKKNRPGVKLSVIAPVGLEDDLALCLLQETTSLGVRIHSARRVKCRRWQQEVVTPWGTVRVKVKALDGRLRATPEYDDCLRLACETGQPLVDIYTAVQCIAREAGLEGGREDRYDS